MAGASKARHSRGRVIVALVLLAITVLVCVSLGRWQVARGKEKAALLAQVEDGKRQVPLQVVPATPPTELTAWRPASATGQWLPNLTVLLDNRTAGGRPGFWVVTPLRLDNSSEAPKTPPGYTDSGPVVLVLRGWLPRQFPDQPLSTVPTPAGQVTVSGTLLSHIPRLLELSSLGAGKAAVLPDRLPADGPLPRVQNLDIAAFARASGLTVLPAVLQSSQSDGSLVQDWPAPPANTDMHRGYALQWFSFAAIAAIAFGVLLVRHLRSSRR
jgi:cytochrome oxidase assembly protein ShyY1